LRAAWHQLPKLEGAKREAAQRQLDGKLAYLAMLNPRQAESLRVRS